jgi:hypothetical protein
MEDRSHNLGPYTTKMDTIGIFGVCKKLPGSEEWWEICAPTTVLGVCEVVRILLTYTDLPSTEVLVRVRPKN